jgi:Spy/CpxP family protein refolding chaperone
LNEKQKKYVQWDEQTFAYAYDPKNYNVGNDRNAFETKWAAELAKPEPGYPGIGSLSTYDEAIIGLAVIKSDKALAPLVKIAAERVLKDNAHRHYATKALGILGNPAAVPELIPLVYHFNFNTRWDAQVSLVRLTGQNFGGDAKAWGEWYTANKDKLGKDLPAFDATPVDWSCGSNDAQTKRWCDPKVQEESDNQWFGMRPAVKAESVPAVSPAISFLTPAWVLEQEAQERPMYYSYWDGHSTMSTLRFSLRFDDDKWLNITPEQKEQFRFLAKPQEIGVEWFRKKREEQDPELMKAFEDAEKAKPVGDPTFRRATEEQKRAYVKAAGKSSELFDADVSRQIEKALTPEQLAKLQSLEFLLLPEMGIACPGMFDCLELSDEQKAKVEAIRKELRPEFEKMLDLRVAVRQLQFETMIEHVTAHDKATPLVTQNEVSEAMSAAATRVFNDRAFAQKQAESEKQNKEFALKLKVRLTELLTAEQKAKMQTMIDNAPDFVKGR